MNGEVTNPAWKTKPSWYLVATDDHMIPVPAQRMMANRAGAKTADHAGSHASGIPPCWSGTAFMVSIGFRHPSSKGGLEADCFRYWIGLGEVAPTKWRWNAVMPMLQAWQGGGAIEQFVASVRSFPFQYAKAHLAPPFRKDGHEIREGEDRARDRRLHLGGAASECR